MVGGGIRMGNTYKPMAVLFQCMTKFTTNKKKKKRNRELTSYHQLEEFGKGRKERRDTTPYVLQKREGRGHGTTFKRHRHRT